MNKSVTVRVPATSANMGPGFDVVGLALNIYCEVSFSLTGETLVIEGCSKKFANSSNLSFLAFSKTLEKCGKSIPMGLNIKINSDIPIARGLGSSSALIVAGIEAANCLYELKLNNSDILSIATEIEGHPDNVAPCIFGGMVSSFVKDGECYEAYHKISENLRFAVIIPDYQVATEMARVILPQNISRQDAVYSLSHYGLLVSGFSSGDRRIISEALHDKMHQPYRKALIKDFDSYQKLSMDNNALGFVISGSGSTMLIVGDEHTDFEQIKANIYKDSSLRLVRPCLEGAVCQTNI